MNRVKKIEVLLLMALLFLIFLNVLLSGFNIKNRVLKTNTRNIMLLNDNLEKKLDSGINCKKINENSVLTMYRIFIEDSPDNHYIVSVKNNEVNEFEKIKTSKELYSSLSYIEDIVFYNNNNQPKPNKYSDEHLDVMIEDLIGESPVIVKILKNEKLPKNKY